MKDEVEGLRARIARALARSAPEDWRVLTLRVSCAGDMTQTGLIATRTSGTLNRKRLYPHEPAMLPLRHPCRPGEPPCLWGDDYGW